MTAGTINAQHDRRSQHPDIPPELPLPEKLVNLQEAADRREEWTRPVYDNLGVYLGYTLAHFTEFYDFANVLVLGRVTSGAGGEIITAKAREVLRDEVPELSEKISFVAVDEKFKRHGQAIAAASLPRLRSRKP